MKGNKGDDTLGKKDYGSVPSKREVDYSLYLVTDSGLMTTATIEESVGLGILGGCTIVQLRENDVSSLEFYQKAVSLREFTTKCGVPFIINNRVDIALAISADGVHIGQNDLPYKVAREILGPDKLIGVSCNNVTEAKEAEAAGADYIGVGAMFATGTKTNTRPVTIQELKEIRHEVSIPIVAIGGINKDNIALLEGTGIDGVAVVSAIVAQEDIAGAAKEMKKRVEEVMAQYIYFKNDAEDATKKSYSMESSVAKNGARNTRRKI